MSAKKKQPSEYQLRVIGINGQLTLLAPHASCWAQRNRTLLSYGGNTVVQLKGKKHKMKHSKQNCLLEMRVCTAQVLSLLWYVLTQNTA